MEKCEKLPNEFRRYTQVPITKVALAAFLSRVILLLAMAMSCLFISSLHSFYPGDDVWMFDLRLEHDKPTCFCLKGTVCDLSTWDKHSREIFNHIFQIDDLSRVHGRSHSQNQSDNCAVSHISSLWRHSIPANTQTLTTINDYPSQKIKDSIYHFFLLPLTRWDAARFLSIAVRPSLRNPYSFWPSDPLMECKQNTHTHVCDPWEQVIQSSEQAHAFLPLVPVLIRYTALFLVLFLPASLLPSTFEATAVLAAFLVNTLCFIGTANVLQKLVWKKVFKRGRNMDESYKASIIATCIFCWNPASVFFTSSYSESIFACLTFIGYYFMEYEYPRGIIIATIFWTMASMSRSNGILTAGYIPFHLMSKMMNNVYTFHENKSRSIFHITYWMFGIILFHLSLALIIALPLRLHDIQGYQIHCHPVETRDTLSVPDWCLYHHNPTSHFSLYAHVQRKYWNVGFLRYYQLKQIPNFFLAVPILYLGIQTVVQTITNVNIQSADRVKGSMHSKISLILDWMSCFFVNDGVKMETQLHSMKDKNKSQMTCPSSSLLDMDWMGHVLVLTMFCFMGATIAHVQISTRLICSSCPVIYVRMTEWYLDANRKKWLILYLALFNIMGILLHPNWLPWT